VIPNRVVTTSQYDGLNRLTRLTHAKGANTLADFQYQFNTVNDITQLIDSAGTHNYSYDQLDRLTAATHPNQINESYTYDDVGNRTASHQGSSYTYQPFNQLVAANGASFSYDANGNLISKTDAGGSWTFTWDTENRLKQASQSGGLIVTYAYDALGRRIQRTAGTVVRFVSDGVDVIRDLDGNGATIADYLNAPGLDNKLRQTVGGSATYFLADHMHTTRALSDSSGSLAFSLSYDSFGNLASGPASTRYTYTGRELDADNGLMFYRARWYQPEEGRFASEDPIGFAGGLNLFTYVGNSVPNRIDPRGTFPGFAYTMSKDDREWWGYFFQDLFIKRQDCRPARPWLSRFGENFYETNVAVPGLGAPAIFPGVGLGLLTSRATASAMGTPTLWEWAMSGFAPASSGAAELTALETGVVAAGSAVVNTAFVTFAYEGGIAIGSAINASFPRHCDCR
jgi:RHS repeat-associated protein